MSKKKEIITPTRLIIALIIAIGIMTSSLYIYKQEEKIIYEVIPNKLIIWVIATKIITG